MKTNINMNMRDVLDQVRSGKTDTTAEGLMAEHVREAWDNICCELGLESRKFQSSNMMNRLVLLVSNSYPDFEYSDLPLNKEEFVKRMTFYYKRDGVPSERMVFDYRGWATTINQYVKGDVLKRPWFREWYWNEVKTVVLAMPDTYFRMLKHEPQKIDKEKLVDMYLTEGHDFWAGVTTQGNSRILTYTRYASDVENLYPNALTLGYRNCDLKTRNELIELLNLVERSAVFDMDPLSKATIEKIVCVLAAVSDGAEYKISELYSVATDLSYVLTKNLVEDALSNKSRYFNRQLFTKALVRVVKDHINS